MKTNNKSKSSHFKCLYFFLIFFTMSMYSCTNTNDLEITPISKSEFKESKKASSEECVKLRFTIHSTKPWKFKWTDCSGIIHIENGETNLGTGGGWLGCAQPGSAISEIVDGTASVQFFEEGSCGD